MRYVLRQKLLSFGDDFVIQDDSGRERFAVRSKVLRLTQTLVMEDWERADTWTIRRRLLEFGPTYDITHGDNVIAVVKKELFTFFSCRFTVDVPGPDDLSASGDLLDHEYIFERAGRAVASVSKRFFSWTDTYGVDIADGEDDALILASAVVIDLACHDE